MFKPKVSIFVKVWVVSAMVPLTPCPSLPTPTPGIVILFALWLAHFDAMQFSKIIAGLNLKVYGNLITIMNP